MTSVTERFLKYVSFDTQSDENSPTCPSTAKQKILGAAIVEEMKALGITNPYMDEDGYVYGTVPGDPSLPTIGLIAHMDTSPDASGANIKTKFVAYEGGDVCLNEEKDIWLRESDYPSMKNHVGKNLIVTDGTTLLGADDKAGIAEIMDAVQYIVGHPEFKHGDIMIGFTPDEEIGRGVVKFDVAKFGAKYAYTLDGGAVGELEYENFNAAGATVTIQGRNVHPGTAKGKMKNAILIGMELNSLLPVDQKPEYTCGYEGFFHLISFKGEVESATFSYIIRDHDMDLYEQKKAYMQKCVDFINEKYGAGTATVEIRHQYYNMRKEVEPHYHIVEKAMKAMEMEGITPKIQPIRGGTDGANLSFMGLPCPNIFAGGHNFHGKMEYVPLESMEKASKVILNIISLYAE